MNVFRLVLCLSGLMIYFVVRQIFQPSPGSDLPQSSGSVPVMAPEATVPAAPPLRAAPRVELLKQDQNLVSMKK